MNKFVKLVPEIKTIYKAENIYKLYTKKMNRIKRKLKDFSKIDEKFVIKLEKLNLVRFGSFLIEMNLFKMLEEEDKPYTVNFLAEQINSYALDDIFQQELECLKLTEAFNLNLNTNVVSENFDFCLNFLILETVNIGVDLEIIADLLKKFINNRDDLRNLKKGVLEEYNKKVWDICKSDSKFNKEEFENLRYNLNILFSSIIEKPKNNDMIIEPLFNKEK